MENTRRVDLLAKARVMAGKAVVYIILAFIIGRGVFWQDGFPAAVAFIAFMVYRNTINIYLVIPAAIGMVPMIAAGCDGMANLIAMASCGLIFVVIRRVKTLLWQRTLLTGSIYIICSSVYRIASHTVYRLEVEELLLQSFIIMVFMYVFEIVFELVKKREAIVLPEICIGCITAFCLLILQGIGMSFFMWPIIIIIALWACIYCNIGEGTCVVIVGGIYAALAGQGQWGMAITVLIGLFLAAVSRKYGKLTAICSFTAACFLIGKVESGVILGVDKLCLFPAVILFLLLSWRFDKGLSKIGALFSKNNAKGNEEGKETERLLETRAEEMSRLAGMYETYLDSRSVFADQFMLMEQMLIDIRNKTRRIKKGVGRDEACKFSVKIAISQCAAMGTINGDHCSWQDIGNGRTAMIISDGMGRGKKAATESHMVTKTIMPLLKAGVSVDMALKMVNTIMLTKGEDDSYATVDLVIINKNSGKAKFYKIGAAPTLLRRGRNIEEVQLSAVPLGIVNGLKVDYVEAGLRRGDWVIMMSDGISDGGSRKGIIHEIKETAVSVKSENPQIMCDLIINRAADSYIGRERDDLSVLVAKIE